MFFVYILKSIKDGKLYIGQTNDLADRFRRHTNGEVRATKYRRPLELIHEENHKTRIESMNREKYLKSLKSSKYILENIVSKDKASRP